MAILRAKTKHSITGMENQKAQDESSIADAGRHLEVRNFKLQELVENETITLKYIDTQRQVADLLTKSLGKIAFERLRDDLTGYLAVRSPGQNIHVLHARWVPRYSDVDW